MKRILKVHYIFVICLVVFCLLLYKDIFSIRTLVPNIEPFPDSIHYVNAARSFLNGYGLNIVREDRILATSVPPLYSIFLIPAFVINSDARMFYFINILLALTSFFIFYRVLMLLLQNSVVKGFILLLYITNYYLYWFPNLAMAENLILLLFNTFILLLFSKANFLNVFSAGIIVVAFYATKYASIPLTGSFFLIYFIKLFFLWRSQKIKISGFLLFFLGVFLAFSAFSISEYLTKRIIPFSFLLVFASYFNTSQITQTSTVVQTSSAGQWFSLDYMKINIGHYLNAVTGGSERFLWDFTPLVPKFVAFGGLLGLFWGVLVKRYRLVCVALLIALGSSVLFMSAFYSVDMRYISQIIPTLLLGFGLFLQLIFYKINKSSIKKVYYIGIIFLVIFYIITNSLRIKNQIMLNIRHAETPWYYVNVLELNKFFTSDKILDGKKPIVISPMTPYYIDFFSNKNYNLLPLSPQQEFRNTKEVVWGPDDYSDLIKLYKSYLDKGYVVYVAKYGIGNESYLNEDFQNIANQFKLIKVVTACYDVCNVYRIDFK